MYMCMYRCSSLAHPYGWSFNHEPVPAHVYVRKLTPDRVTRTCKCTRICIASHTHTHTNTHTHTHFHSYTCTHTHTHTHTYHITGWHSRERCQGAGQHHTDRFLHLHTVTWLLLRRPLRSDHARVQAIHCNPSPPGRTDHVWRTLSISTSFLQFFIVGAGPLELRDGGRDHRQCPQARIN